jgi:1-deoxy-D-xylulose-5-phosphate synthase
MSTPRQFDSIPQTPPGTPLLDRVASPADLRALDVRQLAELCDELRAFLLYSVAQTGGHFGAGLGVVELTAALHYVFDTPRDLLVWDVGHQAYPHKILTGRRARMPSMRQAGGLAPFPQRDESEYDTFGVGHSSTSISAALGLAIAERQAQPDRAQRRRVVAVIGDGALTAGMAFEALNHAAEVDVDLLVVLNDNAMSISRNTGGLARYCARILASRFYASVRAGGKRMLSVLPPLAAELARKTEEHMKGMVVPGTLFEELGFNYVGPVDGHDVGELVTTLGNLRERSGHQFLHVVTTKGKGYAPAESNPIGSHSLTKIEPRRATPPPVTGNLPKYSQVFGRWLVDMAAADERLVGITPAMREGSDLVAFSERFPDRYFDTAIAEQHAVTLAAGLACGGLKPVVAIYSTFLQRAYDQLIHDVAIQDLDVTFAIDRAGLVEDGPTHSGIFDLSYLRCVPNLVVMAPADEDELRRMLTTAYQHPGPAAVRYPRGTGVGVAIDSALRPLPIGRGEVVRDGARVAILAFGTLLAAAREVADALGATLVNMRFVKPLDTALVRQLALRHELLVSVEENVVAGGAGAAVLEFLAAAGLDCEVVVLGIPDRFIGHGDTARQLAQCGLDAAGIRAAIEQRLGTTRARARARP